ncbi:MAG: hypothetical protein KAU28_00110, partial [Phycisphaerae bacterium]|nr:hypothetical protein [Phycisphaerae bacterium]
ANEHLLVEYAIGSRRTFKGTIDELVELYDRKGEQLKARLVRNVKARLDPVRTYMYFLGAEIPGPELRPKDLIPAADALYGKAMKLYSEGKPLPLVTDYPKQRKALMLLLKLVRQYPRSDKIALSAYFIAEIYKEYFDENVRAVHWYERAWQWDGDIAQPARFQAATIYDLRMHDVDNAIRCYKLSAQHDPPRLANRGTSLRRIRELTEQMQRP